MWLLASIYGCAPESAPAPPSPNVILVTFDTTRWDDLDFEAPTATPTWAALAAAGTRFEHAFTPAPLTLPAHATLLTGLEPPRHGVRNNGGYRLDPGFDTLAEVARGQGYATAAVVAAPVLYRRYGLDQGFDSYDDAPGTAEEGQRTATEVTDRALAAVGSLKSPWLLWVHYFDPHDSYAPPAVYRQPGDDEPALHRGEVAYADAELGRLLAAVGRGALVVATADHGESLGEHGEFRHGFLVHDSTTRVPLVVSWPGTIDEGLVVPGPARHADILPTVATLMGWPIPQGLDGVVVVPWSTPASPRLVYAESAVPSENFGLAPITAMREGDVRLVRTHRDRLFDLASDPGELVDVVTAREGDRQRLGAALDVVVAAAATSTAPGDVGDDERRQLEALGYVHAPLDEAGGDIYDHLDFAVRVSEAKGLVGKEPERAYAEFLALAEAYPGAPAVWESLVPLARDLGKPGYAALAAKAADANPGEPALVSRGAWVAMEGGDRARGSSLLDAFLVLAKRPGRHIGPGSLTTAAKVALGLGRDDDALYLLESVADPLDDVGLLLARARLRHRGGRVAAALPDYARCVELAPNDASAWLDYGYALASERQLAEAAGAIEKSLALEPMQVEAWARLALLDQGLGRAEAAKAACEAHRQRGGRSKPCD